MWTPYQVRYVSRTRLLLFRTGTHVGETARPAGDQRRTGSSTMDRVASPQRGRQRSTGKLRRSVNTAVTVAVGLAVSGLLYSTMLPRPQLAAAQPSSRLSEGQQLYARSCSSCHGQHLEGVPGRGPGLIGVGQAAVYLQVSSGRMPLARQDQPALRKAPSPEFDPGTVEGQHNLDALGTYIQEHGNGPTLPTMDDTVLRTGDPARGGELFRENCASCHNFTGRGGTLTWGKNAPNLDAATPTQMYAAMLSGPQGMPRFGDRELTPGEKKDVIAYVLSIRDQRNSLGGFNLGEIGPTTEGLVAFTVGIIALVVITLWLGART